MESGAQRPLQQSVEAEQSEPRASHSEMCWIPAAYRGMNISLLSSVNGFAAARTTRTLTRKGDLDSPLRDSWYEQQRRLSNCQRITNHDL